MKPGGASGQWSEVGVCRGEGSEARDRAVRPGSDSCQVGLALIERWEGGALRLREPRGGGVAGAQGAEEWDLPQGPRGQTISVPSPAPPMTSCVEPPSKGGTQNSGDLATVSGSTRLLPPSLIALFSFHFTSGLASNTQVCFIYI